VLPAGEDPCAGWCRTPQHGSMPVSNMLTNYLSSFSLNYRTGADKGKKKKVAKVESYKLYIYKARSGMSQVCATRLGQSPLLLLVCSTRVCCQSQQSML
jgi:hypothetical protein